MVKRALLDLDWRASLFEKLCFCDGDSTVQGLEGVASCGRPLPASQRTKQCQAPTGRCHSHAYHNLGVRFATVPPLPPKQQMLTFDNSKYYHNMIHSGIFFLVRSDTFPMASSSVRRGLPSRNPEEPGRRQTLSGLHMCHLPCRLLNNWFLIIFRHF